MLWPLLYKDLNESQRELRRKSLDFIGYSVLFSQLTALVYVYIYANFLRRGAVRRLEWRLRYRILGGKTPTRGKVQSVGAALVYWAWMGLMIWLCVKDVDHDYIHLTRAFGMAAAASLPLNVLLGMKYSPLKLVFPNCSYEGPVNVVHQWLGSQIYLLLTVHACLYLKFFWDTSRMKTRLLEADALCGVWAFGVMTILVTSAYPLVRESFYSVFYNLHIIISGLLPPLLYFHVSHSRPYIIATVGMLIVDRVLRVMSTMSTTATISLDPRSSILDILVSFPNKPPPPAGSHILLNVPSLSLWAKNPFTVVESGSGHVRMAARVRGNFTKKLVRVAKVPVNIESGYGGHGVSRELVGGVDRALLIAGGIGGTFALPWARFLKANGVDARFLWVVPKVGDLLWARDGVALAEVYITGGHNGNGEGRDEEGMELLDASSSRDALSAHPLSLSSGRPDIREAVGELVGRDKRALVMVCGPDLMAEDVKNAVRSHVLAGRDVTCHMEVFGH
ncbi:unnamed protein product [Tuber melanosporum]|uniref:(Perigord truffle) hypothetical protein n=1 Tax=Tuber melanosporum (strain Mel28) TaxID=656061 RepID=D5G9H0_TUBMM|nr:uncharacterized protein GSTUM_00003398001 [Tuber melanosporum]CAZ81163.1 unnamed protein product [Tuber melanosporum]